MHPQPRGVVLPRSRTALVAALLLTACASPVLAQRLSIRTFSAADGLGSSFVSHITQDRAGYLWFATRDGLSRWNGYEFTTLNQNDGLATPAVDRIHQSQSGEYFVVCNDGSLYSYRPSAVAGKSRRGHVAFRRRSVRVGGSEVSFTRLYEDSRGILWGGGKGVLIRELGSNDTPIPLNHLAPSPGMTVLALAEDRDQTLWVGTNLGLLRRSPDGTISRYSLAPTAAGDVVNALALDQAGRLWIGHGWLGLVVLNPGLPARPGGWQRLSAAPAEPGHVRFPSRHGAAVVLTRANGLPDDAVWSLLTASDGQVWVGTVQGLARFDGTAFARYTRKNGLCDDLAHALWEDGDGHLWIATPTGAMRVVLEGFSRFTVDEGLATDRIVSIAEAPDRTLHAIGIDWSINTFDGRRFHAAHLPLPAGSSLMWASQAAYLDRKGRWWALTHQGLYRFDEPVRRTIAGVSTPARVYTVRDGLPSPSVFRAYEDRLGSLWVGLRTGDGRDSGLARFDAALARATRLGAPDGLPASAAPSAFAEDRAGSLWVGFYEGGLARYRDGRFRFYSSAAGIPSGMVTAVLLDHAGRLWMSSNLAGIGRIDDPSAEVPTVKTYSIREGLASNNVRALAEDRMGRIYAGNARGVDRLDPGTGRVRQYGTEDGLLSDFVTAALCDSRGDLWFGTYGGGVFRLTPGRERQEEPPPIAVTGLRVAGEPRPVHELGESAIEGFVLDADQRDVAIDFVSVSRHRAYGISYQYSLEPASTWSSPNNARTVYFARLSPGRYRFAVRAVTPGGRTSETPATVAFTIRPPLWQRWWAVSLAVAVLAAAIAGTYRYRVRRLIEIERLRLAIASDLHDEVATNLGSIAMFGTLVRQQLAAPSPFLDRITDLASESVEAIREIIWSIDPRPETVSSLLLRLRDAMVTTCRARGLHLSVAATAEGMDQNLTPEQRKNLWLMLKEAIANAATHSGGTEVSVTATRAGRQVRITVRDNGTGRSAPPGSTGRGLATMRSRAEALGGAARITAESGHGTTVEFLVRLSR